MAAKSPWTRVSRAAGVPPKRSRARAIASGSRSMARTRPLPPNSVQERGGHPARAQGPVDGQLAFTGLQVLYEFV